MAIVNEAILQQWMTEGSGFIANGGVGSTVITFAGAYDANGPDLHVHVPENTTIIPYHISVTFEAVGTESTMEVIGLASSTGDASVTGTLLTIKPLRTDAPTASLCSAEAAVDAGGVTDPNAGTFFEFWREMRPLTDTVASTENDRVGLNFTWTAFRDGPPPIIVGTASTGAALAVYAASQAGTGFITASWAEIPTSRLR